MSSPAQMDSSSHSEVESFVSCERKHYYSYGLKLEGKSQSEALIRGTVGHAALASFYEALKAGNSHDVAVDIAFDMMWLESEHYKGQLFDFTKFTMDLSGLLDDYFTEYEDEDIEILEVEMLHTVQLTDTFEMPVRIDLLARFPSLGIVAIDNKFSWDFYNVEKLDLSPQLPKYLAALLERGIKVDHIMYNELRTRETKENSADRSLKFRRTPVIVTTNKIVTVMREQLMAATRISALKKLPIDQWENSVLRNSSNCNMCSFTILCAAELNGYDSELAKESFYQKRTYR